MRHRDTVDVGRRELSRVSDLTARPYEWFNLRSLIQFLVEETRVLVTVAETTVSNNRKCRKNVLSKLDSLLDFIYICLV